MAIASNARATHSIKPTRRVRFRTRRSRSAGSAKRSVAMKATSSSLKPTTKPARPASRTPSARPSSRSRRAGLLSNVRERVLHDDLATRIEGELDVDGLSELACGRLYDQLAVALKPNDGPLRGSEIHFHAARSVLQKSLAFDQHVRSALDVAFRGLDARYPQLLGFVQIVDSRRHSALADERERVRQL